MITPHTPEPWKRGICQKYKDHNPSDTIVDAHGDTLLTCYPDGDEGDEYAVLCVSDANLDRIIACVNGCAGLNPETVGNMVELLSQCRNMLISSAAALEAPDSRLAVRKVCVDFANQIENILAKAESPT